MEQSNLAKLISNYGARLWSMISVFVFIPLYIEILGAENYGLISFYALLLGIISFADSGMSSAVIRELSQDVDINYKYSIFRNLEKKYIIVCLFVSFIIFFFSNIIADYWIISKGIAKEKLVYYIKLIGIGVTSQLISSLYFGALFALDNQVKSNIAQFLWSFSRSALVFLLFIIFSNSIELYFVWQIFCNVLYVLFLRYFIIKELKNKIEDKRLELQFRKLPKNIVSYIGGMIFIAIISSINIQADKLITSKLFDLSTFGYYNIASSLSQIPMIMCTPLIMFAFPLFSKYSKDKEILKRIFVKIYYLILLFAALSCVHIFLYSQEILKMWTKNNIPSHLIEVVSIDAKLLVLGSFFLAMQLPLYYFLLSKGKTKYTIYQGVVQILVGLPLLYLCSVTYGLLGVPFSWLFINFGAFLYLFFIVSKKYLDFNNIAFYKAMFVPIIISTFIGYLGYFMYQQTQIYFIIYFIVSMGISFLLSIVLNNILSKKDIFSYKHFYNFPNE